MNLNPSKIILNWQIFGTVFMIIVGSLLHFAFKWSNYSIFVGIFTPVNESVWEHLKLGFTSLLIFSIIEYPFIKNYANNYFLAKALGILCLELIIVVFFYLYTSYTRRSILFIDIFLYIVGCIACQIICYKLLTMKSLSKTSINIGIILLIINAAAFILFTFIPPRLPLFLDSQTKSYGIQDSYKK